MFEILNPIGIGAAAIAGYAIGALWHSKILFMRTWLEGLGKTETEFAKPRPHMTKYYMWSVMAYTFLVNTVLAFALDLFLMLTGTTTLSEALEISMLLAFGFIVTIKFVDMLYSFDGPHWSLRAQKSFFVGAGYYVVMFLVMGAILYYLG